MSEPIERQDASWNEYRRLVLSELEALSEGLAIANGKLDRLTNDQLVLKMKMAFIGAMAGTVMGAVTALVVGLILRAAHN